MRRTLCLKAILLPAVLLQPCVVEAACEDSACAAGDLGHDTELHMLQGAQARVRAGGLPAKAEVADPQLNAEAGRDPAERSQQKASVVPGCAAQYLDQLGPASPNAGYGNLGGIFVVHASPLVERRAILEKRLERVGLNGTATWVTWLDEDYVAHMSADERLCFITPEEKAWVPRSRRLWDTSNKTHSLCLKHLWVYYHTAKHGLENVVVMEDDTEFMREDVVQELQRLPSVLPRDYLVVHVSGCWGGIHANTSEPPLPGSGPGQGRVYGPGYGSRCASGYMISQRGAQKMLSTIFGRAKDAIRGPKNYGIDRLPDRQQDGVMNEGGFWYEPYLWEQTDHGGQTH